jgi:hypothetical protein
MEFYYDINGPRLTWDLYDHNGCHAGAGKGDKLRIDQSAGSGAGDASAAAVMAGSFSNMSIAGPGSSVRSLSLPPSPSNAPAPHIKRQLHDPRQYIGTEIISSNRPVHDSMYYRVDARVKNPTSNSARTVFTLLRPAANCPTECHPTFEIGDSAAKVPFYITNDCHSACSGHPAITNADVGCSDGANILHRIATPLTGRTAFRRQFWCWWRMPTIDRTLSPNATWRIRLRHEMEYATALVTWTLIDANGFEAGTGKVAAFSKTNSIKTDISSSSSRHGADALAVPIRLTVMRPTVEQDTWLELEFRKTGPNCHECYPVLNTFSHRDTTGRPENAVQGWTWVTTCGISCEKDIIAKPSTDCGFNGEPFAVQGAGRVREFECWFTAY